MDMQTVVGFQPPLASKVRPHCKSLARRCCHYGQTLHGPAALSWPVAAGPKGFHSRAAVHASSAVQLSDHPLDIVEKAAIPRITTRRVLVRMSIPMRVQFGEVLKVVGSGNEFGSWVAARAPRFEWTEGDVWVGNMLMDPGLYEFKVVVFNERTQALRWETSANRVLEVPAGPGTLTLSAHWNAPSTQGWFEPGLPDLSVRLSTTNQMPAASHPTVGSMLLPAGDAAAGGNPATLLSRGWDAMLRRGGSSGSSGSQSSSSSSAAGHDSGASSQKSASSKSASKSSSSSSSTSSKWKAMAAGDGAGSSSGSGSSKSASTSSSNGTAPASDKDRALLVEGMRGLLKSMAAAKADSSSSSSSSLHKGGSSSSSSASSHSKPAALSSEASSSSNGSSHKTPAPARSSSIPMASRATAHTHSQPSSRATLSATTASAASVTQQCPSPADVSASATSRAGLAAAGAAAAATAAPAHRYTPRPGGSSNSPTPSRNGASSSSSSSSRQWGFDTSGWSLALPNLDELDVKSMTDSQKVVKGLAGMLGKGAVSVGQASQALLSEGMQQLQHMDREALLDSLRHTVNQLANSEAAAAAASSNKSTSNAASSGSGSNSSKASAIISPVVTTCSQVMQAVGNIVTTKSPSAMRGDAADFIEMSEGYRKKPPLPAAGLTTRRTPLKREEAVRALVERAAKVRAAKQSGPTLSAALGAAPSDHSSGAALHGSSVKGPPLLDPSSPEQQQQQQRSKGQQLKQQVWEDPFGVGGAVLVAGVVLALLGTEQHGIRQAVGARLTQLTQALVAPVEVASSSNSSNNKSSSQSTTRARTPTTSRSTSSSTSTSTTTNKPAAGSAAQKTNVS